MNLLDKNWFGLLIFTALAIFSCEDPSEVGLGLDPDGINSVVSYEEIVLPAQNVFIDSLRTSGSNRLLVGTTVDEIFGSTVSRAYTGLYQKSLVSSDIEYKVLAGVPYLVDTISMDPEVVVDTLWGEYVLDYAELSLHYDYIDTKEVVSVDSSLADLKIQVREITDQLFSSSDGIFYLSSMETPMADLEEGNEGEIVILPKELLDDNNSNVGVASMTLNQTWSERLWRVANEREVTLDDEFRGIALVSSEGNNSIVGFKRDESAIKLHYHIAVDSTKWEDDPTTVEEDFSLIVVNSKISEYVPFEFETTINGNKVFSNYNYLRTDRTGSLIGGSIGSNFENFSTDDGYVYLHHASGIYPKLDLKPLKDFLDEPGNEYIQINNLEFEVPIVYDSSIVMFPTVNESDVITNLYYIKETGHINMSGVLRGGYYDVLKSGVFTYSNSSVGVSYMPLFLDTTNTEMIGVGSFFADALTKREVLYDVEDEDEDNDTDEWLRDHLIIIPDEKSTVNRSVIPVDGIKLKIFYSNPN